MSQKANYVQLNKEVTATKEGKAALIFTSSFGEKKNKENTLIIDCSSN